MHPGQVTPGPPLAASDARHRQVTPSIRTTYLAGPRWVVATYRAQPVYSDPRDAPVYALMRPVGLGRRGKWSGKWEATIELQALEKTEAAALSELARTLEEHGLPFEREQFERAMVALAVVTDDTPYEYRPLESRGKKKRKMRILAVCADGKKRNFYADTLRRHADPNCICPDCNKFKEGKL